MRGEEEGEHAGRQERGEKEWDAAVSMAKRLEQQPQESDIGGHDSLGKIEGAAPVKGEPHDEARRDEQRGEPHAPCVLLAKNSRDKRAQEQQESRIGEDFLEMGLPPQRDRQRRGRHAQETQDDGVGTQASRVSRPERAGDQADGEAPPGGQRRQGQAQNGS